MSPQDLPKSQVPVIRMVEEEFRSSSVAESQCFHGDVITAFEI